MKRTVLFITLIFMVSIAGAFAEDPVQPGITAPQETKTEVKKADKAKEATVPFTIGEIVVRDRAVPNIEDASTTTVVDGKDIEQRGDKSLGDSLQQVSGITVSPTAKGFTGFNMRGFDHQKVAILVDGIPILDPYYGGNNIDVSSIPVSNVSHIVVNRGVASALYGSLGAVGSINIITKKPEKLTAAAKAEYGVHQNYMINAEAGAPIGNFYAWVTAAYQHSDGYEISKKLTTSERQKWYDKLLRWNIVNGTIGTLQSTQNYLNDDGVWNHTSYSKYQIDGRVGYNITDKMETGISASYFSNVQDSNTFSSNSIIYWNQKNNAWGTAPSNTVDGKNAIFQNRAFSWPEDTKLTVAPYFKADFGDLDVRLNVFYTVQRNNLEAFSNQAETMMFFGPTPKGNSPIGGPYNNDFVQSIFAETSYGFYLMPTYKLASWNKLAAQVHFRVEEHDKFEKALNSATAPDIIAGYGTGEYQVQDMEARYVTLALEDEMHFNTGFGNLYCTIGISYDAQEITKMDAFNASNQMANIFNADSDSMLWGTRDSLNPVIAILYDPIKDFLRLRAAGAMKTEFPSMSIYKDITDATDLMVEPERIYTANAGFELFFLHNAISFRSDYFYTRINDKIESLYLTTATTAYTNIDGYTVQGVENTLQGKFDRIAGIMDLTAALGYVYTYARNYDDSTFTLGESVERTPVHQVTFQLIMDFITKTRLLIWGTYLNNQVVYVMKTTPAGAYSTDYYTTQELHNPFMLNMKVQQELPFNTYVYVTCKNVLDDYNADPFNPGPGRMFYFGGGGRL